MIARIARVLFALAVVASGVSSGVTAAAGPLDFGRATLVATPSSQLELTPVTFGEYQFTQAEFAITVDAEGMLDRSDEAEEDAAKVLGTYFGQLAGCSLVFGSISSGGEEQFAINTSSLIAQAIILNFPDIVGSGTMQRFSLDEPDAAGHVELKLFFEAGCASPSADHPAT